jgi:predicted small secreted protein
MRAPSCPETADRSGARGSVRPAHGSAPCRCGRSSRGKHLEMDMGTLRKVAVWSWLLLCLSGVLLTGCHTVRGAGEDIEGAGRSIERATK